jgi:allantoate deiminase
VENLSVDGGLVREYLDRLYEVGRLPGGGVWRPVYSPAWNEARTLVRGWLVDAGLAVKEDAVGNLFGRLEGQSTGPAVLVGSHIDSVYAGGKYDGPLGVVGAIAAVRALKAQRPRPARPVEVFVSCEEEDSRFICDFWGSRAILGTIRVGEAEALRDADGVVLADAMREYGLDPSRVGEAKRTDVAAFLELHIEQGPVLDAEGISLGVVEAISGLNRTRVRVQGKADHAGTTPLSLRADALVAASAMVLAVRQLAEEFGEPARATVGALNVRPNQPNIVAGEVELIVDSRHPDRALQQQLVQAVGSRCHEIGAERGVAVETEVLVDQTPTPMNPSLVARIEQAIQRRGWSYRRLVSGAGHDSQILGRQIPTAMIFVPSRAGRSHSPAEFTPDEQVLPGVQTLADVLGELAEGGKRCHGGPLNAES